MKKMREKGKGKRRFILREGLWGVEEGEVMVVMEGGVIGERGRDEELVGNNGW